MDGGSTDETAQVVEPYLDRLTFISEKDRGQSHAINKGFAMARGEIVSYLNSDDIILPGAIRRAVEALEADPAIAMVYGDGYQIDIDGATISHFAPTQRFDLWRLSHLSATFSSRRSFGGNGPATRSAPSTRPCITGWTGTCSSASACNIRCITFPSTWARFASTQPPRVSPAAASACAN